MITKITAALAVLSLGVVAPLAFFSGQAQAQAQARRSTCSQGLNPNCDPGAGWTEVWVDHHSSNGFNYTIESSGNILDPVAEHSDCPIDAEYYWWYRYVNSGTGIQFIIDGSDGNFHAIGFTGGKFKLESGVSGVYLSLHNVSGFNWSYVDNSGSYLMDSPDQNNVYLSADAVGTTGSPTHWALVTPPSWPGGSCITAVSGKKTQ